MSVSLTWFHVLRECFALLELTLEIQQTASGLGKLHQASIYFPPVRGLQTHDSCLTMNFTTSSYFAVKLAYATSSDFREKLLFRSIVPLGTEFRQWHTTIQPKLTEMNDFVVSIHARSADIGKLAVINSFHIRPGDCTSNGNSIWSSYLLIFQN